MKALTESLISRDSGVLQIKRQERADRTKKWLISLRLEWIERIYDHERNTPPLSRDIRLSFNFSHVALLVGDYLGLDKEPLYA